MWKFSLFIFFCCFSTAFTGDEFDASGDLDSSIKALLDFTTDINSSGDGNIFIAIDSSNTTEIKGIINLDYPDEDSSKNGNSNSTDVNSFMNGELNTEDSSNSTTTTIAPTTTTPPPTTTSAPTTTTEIITTTTTTTTTPAPETTAPPPTTTETTTTQRTTIKRRRKPTTTPLPPTTVTVKPQRPVKNATTTTTAPSGSDVMSPSSDVPCEFIEEDFICNVEVNCFGEGTIDCEDLGDDVSEKIESKAFYVSTANVKDEEEEEYEEIEDSSVGYFPTELVGRRPPLFDQGLLFKMRVTTTTSPDATETPPAATAIPNNTTNATVSTSTASTSTETTTSTITIKATEALINETELLTTVPVVVESDTNDTVASNSQLDSMEISAINETTSESTNHSVHNSTHSGEEQENAWTAGSTMVVSNTEIVVSRRKRDNNKRSSALDSSNPSALASAESAHLAMEAVKVNIKYCKVSNNLHCSPVPTSAFCRGRGTCRATPSEKSEKSTSAKGVENWAIAVIAICATAAALTISLLAYLVFTSWKKLKVQPHNGVTTLTYVNNTPP